MSSGGVVDRETVTAALDALDAAVDRLVELNFDALTTPEWLALVERCEKVRRRLPVAEHQLINHLARQASAEELGGKLSHAIADWALISRTEAARASGPPPIWGAARADRGADRPGVGRGRRGQRDGKLARRKHPGDPTLLPPAARLD
ncbi:hypothetical protein I547_4124 [Mycobacterium kansasii 824]|nr:hypothetical protein I547_4124 [Mycobacterium kansasii 824]